MSNNLNSDCKLRASNSLNARIIGIVVCGIDQNRQFVTDAYISSIKHAGGLPILIPFVRSLSAIEQYVNLCDGFLFCGGGDISPLLFGQPPLTDIGSIDLKFDLFQIKFIRNVLKTRKPVLAICRGMQVLNVALGGTIFQDISNHMQLNTSRSDPSHTTTIKRGTHLHKIIGSTHISTNSYHHQAIDRLGKGLIATAYASDHIIEAIELRRHPFVIGVQWHPECMTPNSKAMQNLFFSFLRLS